MLNDEVTWVITKSNCSVITWYFVNYTNTVASYRNCLLEPETQSGFNKYPSYVIEEIHYKNIQYLNLISPPW